jgi:hypothetical protein
VQSDPSRQVESATGTTKGKNCLSAIQNRIIGERVLQTCCTKELCKYHQTYQNRKISHFTQVPTKKISATRVSFKILEDQYIFLGEIACPAVQMAVRDPILFILAVCLQFCVGRSFGSRPNAHIDAQGWKLLQNNVEDIFEVLNDPAGLRRGLTSVDEQEEIEKYEKESKDPNLKEKIITSLLSPEVDSLDASLLGVRKLYMLSYQIQPIFHNPFFMLFNFRNYIPKLQMSQTSPSKNNPRHLPFLIFHCQTMAVAGYRNPQTSSSCLYSVEESLARGLVHRSNMQVTTCQGTLATIT